MSGFRPLTALFIWKSKRARILSNFDTFFLSKFKLLETYMGTIAAPT